MYNNTYIRVVNSSITTLSPTKRVYIAQEHVYKYTYIITRKQLTRIYIHVYI